MIRSNTLIAPIAAVLLAAPAAMASPIATVQGTPTLSIYWGASAGGTQTLVDTIALELDGADFGTGSAQYLINGDTINLNFAGGNVDPVITIGVGFVDFGAPSVFTFTVSAPLAPTIGGLANYWLDLAGSFSNGSPNNGGTLGYGTGSFGVMDGLLNGTPFDGLGVPAAFPSGGSSTYGPYAKTGTVDCSTLGGCTTFGITISAAGSGSLDAMSFTGRLELIPVPVPAAVWLLGSAIGLLGWMRRFTV